MDSASFNAALDAQWQAHVEDQTARQWEEALIDALTYLRWVEKTITVDATDPAKDPIEDNPGWKLIHAGTGPEGQTTLTYGWPWTQSDDDGGVAF